MNVYQNYSIQNTVPLTEPNKLIRLGFMVVFILAVAVIPSIATIKFFVM
jgi:hypothetical protein